MMCCELNISDDIKRFVKDIISENNWQPPVDVKYYSESNTSGGNVSKHIHFEIITKDETHKLLIKHALHLKSTLSEMLFSNESYFYDVIYPIYTDFLNEKRVEDAFRNLPQCYGTSSKSAICLENLKEKGFVLFDGNKIMDSEHIMLTLKSLAKFHAMSYAFKDQRRQDYKTFKKYLCRDYLGVETKGFNSSSIKMINDIINAALSKLDIKTDRHIICRCNVEELVNTLVNATKAVNEFSTLTQGECWCNNMVFLYKNNDKRDPIDVIFSDWHLIRPATPVHDISSFLYTVASEETLGSLDTYLNIYYTQLCDEIRKLGSNPGLLYPATVFKREWKEYCKYGFAAAFLLIKCMLVDKDENLKFKERIQYNKFCDVNFFPKFNEEEYIRRIRMLANFMIDNYYL